MIRALFILSLVGCCPKQKPLVVETVARGCIDEPPPQPEPIDIEGIDEGCPIEFAFCVREQAADRIESFIRKSKRWMEQADLACRKGSQP